LTSVHGYNQITETQITGDKNLFKQKIKNIYQIRAEIAVFYDTVGGGSRFLAFQNYKSYFKSDPLATILRT